MRRIVVTDAQHPLARQIASALAEVSSVEFVRGIATARYRRRGDDPVIDAVSIAPDHRDFVEYLRKNDVDTVIQCGLAPDRTGGSAKPAEADVIGTMCTGAAVGHERSGIRSWVVLSSSAIYPVDSFAPLMQREEQPIQHEPLDPRISIAEAEDYARDVAIRNPHINVAILRLQQLVGPGVSGPLAETFAQDPVPVPIGFDPPIQLLHAEDAVSASIFAALNELAGIYNVASEGMIRWSEAARLAGGAQLPVLPVGAGVLGSVLGRLRVPFLSNEVVALARFGQVLDTRKIEQAGFQPKHDQRRCLGTIRRT